MRRFLMLCPLVLAASACTTAPVQTPPPHTAASTSPGQCHADRVQWAVGQEGNETNVNHVWRESGAGLMRPIGPDQAVTMDYRADRVNITLDRNNRITRVSCG